jgi:peptidoglycan hydrolase CwlO-like protein
MDSETRNEQRDRHQAEVEQSQRDLRESIANTERLLSQSDAMLKRHRREREQLDQEVGPQPEQPSLRLGQ